MSFIFCEILAGKVSASFVYRDHQVAAFMDIQPINTGHILIVPVVHAAGLEELSGPDGAAMFATAQRLSRALRASGLRCEGVNLMLANGEAAGQEVFHVHLHAIPRFKNDGFGHKFPESYSQKPPRTALEEAATAIRESLKRLPSESVPPVRLTGG